MWNTLNALSDLFPAYVLHLPFPPVKLYPDSKWMCPWKVFRWNEPSPVFGVNFQIICGLITHWHTIQPQTSIYFLFSCEREKAQRKIACCHFGFFYFTFKKLYLSTFLPLLKFNLNPLPVWSVQIIQFRGKKGQKTNFPVLHSNWHWNVICQPSSFPVFMKSKKNTIRRI